MMFVVVCSWVERCEITDWRSIMLSWSELLRLVWTFGEEVAGVAADCAAAEGTATRTAVDFRDVAGAKADWE
jgi:hypothetical protein